MFGFQELVCQPGKLISGVTEVKEEKEVFPLTKVCVEGDNPEAGPHEAAVEPILSEQLPGLGLEAVRPAEVCDPAVKPLPGHVRGQGGVRGEHVYGETLVIAECCQNVVDNKTY